MSNQAFLIVGANFINKGAEAMLKTVSYQILKRYPNATIYAICHSQEREIARKQGIEPIYVEPSKWMSLLDRIIGKLGGLLGQPGKPYADYTPIEKIKKINGLKTVVDASGFAYGDKRGYIQPLETQKIIDYCHKLKIKYIFMPQAWGSFKDERVAINCKRMIESADAYFTRDDVSQKFVSELLGEPLDAIPKLADIAFHFPFPKIDGKQLLKQNQYSNALQLRVVGISPNMRIYERMPGKGVDNSYVKAIIRIITSLQLDTHIVLIPNEIRPPGDSLPDDSFLCQTIYNAINSCENITLIKGYYSAEEIKSVIRETDLIIASRFHSLIFALSLGIPCLAISWSHKYRELFKLFDLERFVVEDEGMDEKKILALYHELRLNRVELSEKIQNQLPILKKSNEHVFDLL